jgi:hypothetical protein
MLFTETLNQKTFWLITFVTLKFAISDFQEPCQKVVLVREVEAQKE